ncbi:MAG: hypothetical protein RLZZ293_387 [Pseudomonadota bacterium]|jgi:L-threonylcarbamoyladenylate synthase
MYYSSILLKQIAQHLANGGVIAYPTESCYGFGCDPFNYKAINQVIYIKGRSKTKGLIVIAGEQKQLKRLIKPLNHQDQQLINQNYWPGFFSIILPVSKQVPTNLTGKHRKVAVRVTKHKLVRQICNQLNSPLVSTSANKSGYYAIKNYRDCLRQFGQQVMVLPGKIGFAKRPSTIIDWQTKQILR